MVRARQIGLFLLLLTAAGMRPAASEDEFPDHGLLPKAETGADRFLQAHPEYDGRGVVVAIFDTGVDPGAAGLQTTSDGNPKIIDVVDGSGSGDVDTSTVRKVKDGKVEGLTGRTIAIPPDWKCPKGEVRLGIKRAYELYPGRLVGRLKKKARKKWDEKQRAAIAAQEAVLETANAVEAKTPEAKKQKEDLELRLEQLKKLSFDDPGPVFDCVVFHDGATWRAVLDTDEDGDLTDETVLTNFRAERQYATFSDESLLNYAMNVYDDGDTLSIVVDTGAHGTHVAGIVAAHFPDDPDLNGIAPGAQIVSVKIGDTRNDSSSSGTGSVRGLIAALENGCDLINMSYGGASPYPNDVRTARLYTEIVNKHGVIFVASAGNEGPGLSTVGGPGGTTSAIFGIGAYLSPSMMKAQYALRKDVPPNYFMWSSRGPTLDGAFGVDFSAPGGAIAPVPTWSLQGQMHMNGTSMSAPNACGGIALLRSAMKANKMPYSPHRVRRALENTARRPEGARAYDVGAGLIQIDRAWAYLEQNGERSDEDVRYEVTLPRRRDARGIYVREPLEAARVLEARVRVKPHFHEDEDHRRRVAYRNRIRLESSAVWIEAPRHLLLTHGGETFDVRVDPTALPPGAHEGEVRGYDDRAPDRGPLFRVPVTVIRPTAVSAEDDYRWRETVAFTPGKLVRTFLAVPPGATWADVTLRAGDNEASRVYALQTTHLVPGLAYQKTEEWTRLDPNEEEGYGVIVEGGRTLEVCLSQYWSSHGESTCEIEVRFHGLMPDCRTVCVDGAEHATRVLVTAPFRNEDVKPSAELTKLRKRYRPVAFEAKPLDDDRDVLPEGRRIHQCVLTYEFELEDDATIDLKTSLATEDGVWDAHSSSLWMLFDANRRLLRAGGGGDEDVKLDAGTYRVRFHFRHESAKRVEALKQTALLLDIHLGKAISLGVHPTGEAALVGRSDFEDRTLLAGESAAVFLSAIKGKLPKSASPGDELIGTISYGAPDALEAGPGKRPEGFPVRYLVPPKHADLDDDDPDDAAEDDEEPDALEATNEAVRDFMVEQLAKLRKSGETEAFGKLAARILEQHPKHLPVYSEELALAFGKGELDEEQAAKVVKAANAVIDLIDRKALAEHFGVNRDPDDKQDKKRDDEMAPRKAALIDALRTKVRALAGRPKRANEFEAAYTELKRWADMSDEENARVQIAYERGHGRFGAALKVLERLIDDADEPDEKDFAARADLYHAMGWPHWAAYERTWNLIRFPESYPRF